MNFNFLFCNKRDLTVELSSGIYFVLCDNVIYFCFYFLIEPTNIEEICFLLLYKMYNFNFEEMTI